MLRSLRECTVGALPCPVEVEGDSGQLAGPLFECLKGGACVRMGCLHVGLR